MRRSQAGRAGGRSTANEGKVGRTAVRWERMCGGIEGHLTFVPGMWAEGQFTMRQGLVSQRQIWILLTDHGRPVKGLKRCLLLGRKVMTNLDSILKKQRHYFANKCPSSQGYGFYSSRVWKWELDYKESWVPKNWCFWTVSVGEDSLESLGLQGYPTSPF